MARRRYTEEFRIEAVKQVTENGYAKSDQPTTNIKTIIEIR